MCGISEMKRLLLATFSVTSVTYINKVYVCEYVYLSTMEESRSTRESKHVAGKFPHSVVIQERFVQKLDGAIQRINHR